MPEITTSTVLTAIAAVLYSFWLFYYIGKGIGKGFSEGMNESELKPFNVTVNCKYENHASMRLEEYVEKQDRFREGTIDG